MEFLDVMGGAQVNIIKVRHFVESLKEEERKQKEKKGKISFSWRGALSELKGEYTSVELQHKALDWW